MMTRMIFLALFLAGFFSSYGQDSNSSVHGIVTDASTGQPLVGASVFLDRTTLGTSSDGNGRYRFRVLAGMQTLVVSFVGYESFNISFTFDKGRDYQFDAALRPSVHALEQVTVAAKRDEGWQKLEARFERGFFGETTNGSSCILANPWVLDLRLRKDTLLANAAEPLEIINPRLGYQLKFYLSRYVERSNYFQIKGFAQFKVNKAANFAELKYWEENRDQAYRGSVRHFLQALVNQCVRAEGFRVFIDKKDYERTYRAQLFSQELTRAVNEVDVDTLNWVKPTDSARYRVSPDRRVEIHYMEKLNSKRAYKDIPYEVTWLTTNASSIEVDAGGVLFSPQSFSTSGSMASARVGDLLPFDYEFKLQAPTDRIRLNCLVREKETKAPVSSAMVFLNRTDVGAITPKDGTVSLEVSFEGFADFCIVAPGFIPFRSRMNLEHGMVYTLTIDLSRDHRAKEWSSVGRRDVSLLNDIFARAILNERAGDIPVDSLQIQFVGSVETRRTKDSLNFRTTKPISVKIPRIGYVAHACFPILSICARDTVFDCLYYYEQLPVRTKSEFIRRELARSQLYSNSKEKFLKSLVSGHPGDFGFTLSGKLEVTKSSLPAYFQIEVSTEIAIESNQIYWIKDLYDRGSALTVSRMRKVKDKVLVTADGLLFDEQSVRFSGAIGKVSIWNVPINYVPRFDFRSWNNITALAETFVVQTNKDYYYPGELIWVSGFVKRSSDFADSLSSVIHFQLLDKHGIIISDQMSRLSENGWSGYLHLPATTTPDNYSLRVYTNWSRNFDRDCFLKTIPVIAARQNFESRPSIQKDPENIVVTYDANGANFHKREPVTVKFKITDRGQTAIPLRFCSISVTDTAVVKTLPPQFHESRTQEQFLAHHFNPIDRGIAVEGRLSTKDGRAYVGKVQLINFSANFFESTDTDTTGYFRFHNGLFFTDSADFYLRRPGLDNNQETLVLEKTEDMPDFPGVAESGAVVKEGGIGRVDIYQPEPGTIMLNEVVIQQDRIESLAERTMKNEVLYGVADKTISGSEIMKWGRSTDWVQGLQGRVAGVQIRGQQVMLRAPSSLMGDTSPLFLVDGIPGDINIDPILIDRVEIVKRAVPIYGARGSGGIIAVYTKRRSTLEKNNTESVNSNGYLKFSKKGFQIPLQFSVSDPQAKALDLRSTIYWNPRVDVVDGEGSIRFYAGDVPTTYRISLVGVTTDLETFSSTFFITVK